MPVGSSGPQTDIHKLSLPAAVIAALNGRTAHRAIGAKYTAVTRLRLEPEPTTFAVIKELAGVALHRLESSMPATRASDGRLELHA